MRYFAYASNMSVAVMAATCPRHSFLAAARLPGHRLSFRRRSSRTGTGVADILPDPGAALWGALYDLGDGDLEQLDRKEGRGFAYERREMKLEGADGTPARALVYVVIEPERDEIAPSRDYLDSLLTGARERGLPHDYRLELELLRGRWALE